MRQLTLTIANPQGLHARPAAVFVQTAKGFRSAIRVGKNGHEVDAKSILSVLTLNVGKGAVITLSANGEDEEAALNALQKVIEAGLGEPG
jgi:phosphotransferase system HPr (HPr) family protein